MKTKLNHIEKFVIYKLERRSATLSGMAFDTESDEETVKKAIEHLRVIGYEINDIAGWYSLVFYPTVERNE